jgi:hypothetical protein
MLRRVALVRTDVSEEPGASFIRVTRIGELGTTQAATGNRRTLRRTRGVTSQKTPFFIVTAVKTSNLTLCFLACEIPECYTSWSNPLRFNLFESTAMFSLHPPEGTRLAHWNCTGVFYVRSSMNLSVMTMVNRCFLLMFIPVCCSYS